jgi:E-phenylitaconyl-CoA hydratase
VIRCDVDQEIAVVTIDRPQRLNALDERANRRLAELWAELDAREDVLVAILTGAGDRAFCAGSDLKEAAVNGFPAGTPSVGALTRMAFSKPVIAAVNGLAFGGGLELLLATDLRIAVPSATFCLPETAHGLIAGGGGLVRLPFNVPWAIAVEMALRGRVLSAEEAARFGLVNRVVAAEELVPSAFEWAHELRARGQFALRVSKAMMLEARGLTLERALEREQRFSTDAQRHPDGVEGIAAFAEKRAPRFARP